MVEGTTQVIHSIIKVSYHQLQQLAHEPREARRNISSARSAELIDRQNIYKSSTSNLSRAKRGVIASHIIIYVRICVKTVFWTKLEIESILELDSKNVWAFSEGAVHRLLFSFRNIFPLLKFRKN